MIKSMTGYGGARGSSGGMDLVVELRSVNNRYLDCTVRMPRIYTAYEDVLKAKVQEHISRGKIDVFVTIDSSNAENAVVNINKALAEGYLNALQSLSDEYGLQNKINALDLLRLPDVLSVEKSEIDTDRLFADIGAVLDEALAGFDAMRSSEGRKMFDDISARLLAIERLTTLAEEYSPKSVEEYRTKLEARMSEILQSRELDEARILTEAAIFADKVAINEELVRLHSHTEQLRGMINSDEPIGRKLDFLVQELNREANTIGSKCSDIEMSKVVVDLKAEIEKIREQAQNIE